MTTWTVFTSALMPLIPDVDVSFVVTQAANDKRSRQAEENDDNIPFLRSIMLPNDLIDACFGEAGDKGKLAFAAAGVIINEQDQSISFTTEGLKAAAMIPYRVMADYDRDDNKTTGIWADLELQGDDDVDYFGGYLTPLIDTLYAYAQSQGIPVLPVTKADYTKLLVTKQ